MARHVFAAVDHLAWGRTAESRAMLSGCLSELESFRAHELELADEFEQLARLQEFTSAPLFLDGLPDGEPLADLIRSSWQRTAFEIRGLVLTVLETWAQNPTRALALLDRLRETSPAGLEQAWRIVRQMPVPWHVLRGERTAADLREMLHDFLQQEAGPPYARWRGRLAEFCVYDAVTLDEVVEFLCAHSMFVSADEWVTEISADLPLRCLHHGCLAFQGAMTPDEQ